LSVHIDFIFNLNGLIMTAGMTAAEQADAVSQAND